MNNKLSLLVNFVAVDKLSGAMKNIVGLGRNGSSALRGLNGEARKLGRELKDVQRALSKGTGNVTELVNEERKLERALAGVNTRLERQKRLIAIASDRRAMIARGEELKSRGQANVIGGAALATPFILASKAAMDFSSGMVDIQQKAQLTNRETDAMAQNILRAAAAAHQLPEDMRAGIDTLAGFGLDPRVAEKMIVPIGRLGTAFKVEIADGAAAAFANLNNLKIAAADTGKALDIMAAGANYGAFEAKDMARYFPALTAQMQALGQKGLSAAADLTAGLEIARRATGDAEGAATNVQDLLAKINAPVTITAFKKNFGVDLPKALKQLYAQGKTPLEAIAELTNKVTKGDLSKVGFAFRNQEAASAVRALIQNMDDFRKMRADLAKSGGTVDQAFAQREARDASIQWKSFLGTASQLAITLGTTVLPVANRFLGMANSILVAISAWAQRNPRLASTLANLAAGFVVAKIGLGALQFAFGGILGPLANVIAWLRKAGPVFMALRTAVLFLGQGFLRAGAMMLANPIVLIITAIVVAIGLAAYLIYTHWDKIKAAFWGGVAWVKKTLGDLPAWLRTIGALMMQGLLMALNPAILANRLVSIARAGVTAFKNYFGIKSPSRLMMEMGGHIAGGLERGIDGGRHGPARAARRMATGVAAGASLALTPVHAATPARGVAMKAGGDSIVIHVHGAPGQPVEALADAVIRKLEHSKGIKARRTYEDPA